MERDTLINFDTGMAGQAQIPARGPNQQRPSGNMLAPLSDRRDTRTTVPGTSGHQTTANKRELLLVMQLLRMPNGLYEMDILWYQGETRACPRGRGDPEFYVQVFRQGETLIAEVDDLHPERRPPISTTGQTTSGQMGQKEALGGGRTKETEKTPSQEA